LTEEELKNKEKRKTTPLTTEEYLTFFFFPYINTGSLGSFTKSYNQSEDERFIKYEFDVKLKQAKKARGLGLLFYAIVMFLLLTLVKYLDLV